MKYLNVVSIPRAPKIYSGENKKSDVTLFAWFNDHSAVVVKSRGFSCHEYANITVVLTINADLASRIKDSIAVLRNLLTHS